VLLFVGVALGSLLLLAAVYAARTVLVQLVVAIVLAMAAEPLVQALQRRGLRRGTAVGASFALVHPGSLDARPPRRVHCAGRRGRPTASVLDEVFACGSASEIALALEPPEPEVTPDRR
jgi:hypothetical protein